MKVGHNIGSTQEPVFISQDTKETIKWGAFERSVNRIVGFVESWPAFFMWLCLTVTLWVSLVIIYWDNGSFGAKAALSNQKQACIQEYKVPSD